MHIFVKSKCLLLCIAVVIAYMLWCAVDVFIHFASPYWPDRVLYDRAKEAAMQIGVEKLQQAADSVLCENLGCSGGVAMENKTLWRFAGKLGNVTDIWSVEQRQDSRSKCLEIRFGTHDNYSWIVFYPSWEDVRDVKDLRWIGTHLGVRDNPKEEIGVFK